tara:strand:- start:26 stop:259 length:234 start_codon:yes stop_codon:yes gene_type:complete
VKFCANDLFLKKNLTHYNQDNLTPFYLFQIMTFLVEQYFDFAFDISDYIYLMQRGKIINDGKKNDLDRKVFMKKLSI